MDEFVVGGGNIIEKLAEKNLIAWEESLVRQRWKLKQL